MQILNDYQQSDLLFIDIETCRTVDKLVEGSQLKQAFEYKFRYNDEVKDKSGRYGEKVQLTMDELFNAKAALYGTFGKIVTIVVGRVVSLPDTGDVLKLTSYSGDERKLLENFSNDLSKFTIARPLAAFCGFNSTGFDLPFIVKRMLVNNVRIHNLLDSSTKKPWEIRTLDLSKVWQGASFYPDSLQAVCAALNIPSSKSGMHGDEVGDALYAGKIKEIVEYCRQDVLATTNVYRMFAGKSLIKILEEVQPSPTLSR